ncbi:RluA family pseudouridine synthase [Thermosediminibacter oceani]|uniref:Pseudouridine synthase n=1 Tax=Thermosediminibacter oceani (strain ATCC BAA-1034 / DSM 16646 / JW/IW-1228P) TaxID=555079 RepID=D9S2P0_THEOJ|nr:RluA family pseudouridine synthase [Thermosediminibacter oceani]ADL07667.1 pseudouridine synthase, RluA family [Thermosediminibacter oceani DSM 16646]
MKFVVDETSQGLTVGEFLKANGFSSRTIRRLKLGGKILINGVPAYTNTRISCNDVIEVDLTEKSGIVPSPVPINILYEDDHIIVLNKQPGVVVHPTAFHYNDTIANGVIYYLNQKGKKGGFHPVNRLDRDTTGVLIIALSQHMHNLIQTHGRMKKRYIAVVEGVVKENEGVIVEPIARREGSLIERCVSEKGQKAITRFKVVKRLKDLTVLDIEPVTGRTHQIRVHLSFKGHPVAGDTLYGGKNDRIKRQALHCAEMTFFYPVTGTYLSFKAPLPEDMVNLINSTPYLRFS